MYFEMLSLPQNLWIHLPGSAPAQKEAICVRASTKRGESVSTRGLSSWSGSTKTGNDSPSRRIAHPETPSAKMELPRFIKTGECLGMRIQTILSRVEKFKSLVYRGARVEEQDDGPALVVRVRPRKNNRPVCSTCGKAGRAYDHPLQFGNLVLGGRLLHPVCRALRRLRQ